MCQVSGSRAVNSKDCQDSEMTSTNRIERKGSRETSRERNVRKKDASKQTASNRKGCQDSKMSRANRITREWHHQTRMSRERGIYRGFREMTLLTAVTTRRSGPRLETSITWAQKRKKASTSTIVVLTQSFCFRV